MDERRRALSERLPEASEEFTRAIWDGADSIHRYERRRRRILTAALSAAAFMLVAVGLGAAIARLNAPRPDHVSLSAGHGVAAVSPAPTQTAPRSTVDPDSGSTILLDDGPFEAGEWLCLTDQDGLLVYGLRVPFYEQPSADARSVDAVSGMLVRYLGDAGNGFARVAFSGAEGYVEARYLRRSDVPATLEEGRGWTVVEARLYLTDEQGHTLSDYIDEADTVAAYALLNLLEGVEPADPAQSESAPFGALLVVRLRDADAPEYAENGSERFVELTYMLPRHGQNLLLARDGSLYAFPAAGSGANAFWDIFPVVKAELW